MREKFIYLVVLLSVLFLGIGTTYYFTSKNNVESKNSINKNVTVTEKDSINESIKKVYDSVVVVNNYKNGRLSGYGSGFVYKKDDKSGYIMTNNHVVDGASEIKVTLSSGEDVSAKVLGTDAYMDIAIISIDASKVLTTAQIGDSSKSKIGDTIFTVGTPVNTDYAGTVTKGIISGENREITINNNGTEYMMEAIQIDASINPGNSGGPLVNINGEVIGVNSVKLVESSVEGMGFSIPVEIAMAQVSKLEKGEKIDRPIIGVTLYDLAMASYYSDLDISNVKNGVVVARVQDNSDAKEAGLQANDIIVKVDGTNVKGSSHFKYLLYKHSMGDSIKLSINRGGKEKELTLKLTHKVGD